MSMLSASKLAAATASVAQVQGSNLALVQVITFSSLSDALCLQDAQMIFTRQLRWSKTYRLVAQSCGLQANMREVTLKPNYTA